METAAEYTPTLTYNAEPEEAIADLRGVSCILKMLAASDTANHKNIGDAYGVISEIIEATADRLNEAMREHE